MTRTKNTFKNTLASIGGFLIVFLFGVAIRRLFLQNIDIEYLGYESLFANIFAVLGTLDMGAGSILLYRLYKAIAVNDENEIRTLIAMFARLYRIVAGVVLLLGLTLIPLLHLLIRDAVSDWNYVYLIYLVQLFSTVGILYLSYHRLLLEATQRLSDAVAIETGVRVFSQVLKVLIILYTKNYLLYLSVGVMYNLFAAIFITIRSRRKYPVLFSGTYVKGSFRKTAFHHELKYTSIIRLSQTIFYLMDTILISSVLGLKTVALYGNYTMIGMNTLYGFNTILRPVRASAGNYANTESRADSYQMFKVIDLISFFVASFVLTSLFVLFQPTISILYGEQYLLPLSFLAFYALYCYINLKDNAIRMFRETVSNYRSEVGWAVSGALANIVLSIIGIHFWGIAGVLIGTFISELILETGYYIITYRHRFQHSVWSGFGRTYSFMLLACAEAALTYFATRWIPYSFGGIAARCVFCVVIPIGLNALLFFKTNTFRIACNYLGRMKSFVKGPSAPVGGGQNDV